MGTYWPVQVFIFLFVISQLRNGRIVIIKYKFWDSGFNSARKYNYIAEANNVDPKVMIFVFSLTDRESFEEVQRQVSLAIFHFPHSF